MPSLGPNGETDPTEFHEPDEDDCVSRREFDGTVSHVFSGHGLIDSEVYFSFEAVIGGTRPAVGHSVHVVAVQQHDGGGWHAQQVDR